MSAEVRVCVNDGGTLEPSYASEPFTMHTVIGTKLRSWLAAWSCPSCGLVYRADIMPDPRIEAEARRKAEEDAHWAEEVRRTITPLVLGDIP